MLREILGKAPPLYRMVNRIRGFRLHDPEIAVKHQFLGSWYGGWALPDGCLTKDSIVYSVGVGEDISFDQLVIEQVGCTIHAFDPTPIASAWLAGQVVPETYIFHNVGLAESDGEMEFFPPIDAHSFSRTPGHEGAVSIKCPVRRLASLMAELGHDHIDLLKMDIEGFEYAVIDDFLVTGIRPRILNVEFHHKVFDIQADQTKASVRKLQEHGYKIYWVSDLGREYGFILDAH